MYKSEFLVLFLDTMKVKQRLFLMTVGGAAVMWDQYSLARVRLQDNVRQYLWYSELPCLLKQGKRESPMHTECWERTGERS